ncbi:hypothetical protein [Kitasatospora sp. NPDC090308]|uniref:hypothetical protein n=1 Tax=Kitasatospora sp. NPDC090308 TaxID=3364082 RepID=UPI003829A9C2
MPTTRTPEPHTQASLLTALAEAVRDRDERALRRLLARLAEQVTFTDLPNLRSALETRHRGNRPQPDTPHVGNPSHKTRATAPIEPRPGTTPGPNPQSTIR